MALWDSILVEKGQEDKQDESFKKLYPTFLHPASMAPF